MPERDLQNTVEPARRDLDWARNGGRWPWILSGNTAGALDRRDTHWDEHHGPAGRATTVGILN